MAPGELVGVGCVPTMTTEEKRERNRLYQRRFYAKAHKKIPPPLPPKQKREKKTIEENRLYQRLYKRRFYAKAHKKIPPPLPSKQGTPKPAEPTPTPATTPTPKTTPPRPQQTPAKVEDDSEYEAAVRQHLADVAAGNIPPADRLSPHREPVLRVSRE